MLPSQSRANTHDRRCLLAMARHCLVEGREIGDRSREPARTDVLRGLPRQEVLDVAIDQVREVALGDLGELVRRGQRVERGPVVFEAWRPEVW